MKVKFELLSKKVILCNHVNDVIMGDFCEENESPNHDYKYTYCVIRVDKKIEGEDEIRYSYLTSRNDSEEVYVVSHCTNDELLGKLRNIGDVIWHKNADYDIRYEVEGLLHTDTPILSGAVLKYMERRNDDEQCEICAVKQRIL